ncbi:hypothetical protein ACFL2T_01415 [Elusimicrobiota bacterium]
MSLAFAAIKVCDLIKNESNGAVYAVKEIRVDNLCLVDETGTDVVFRFLGQFVACTEEEAKKASHLVDIARARLMRKRKVPKKLVGRKVGIDQGKIRAEFDQYDESLKLQNASDHKNFMEFWKKLVKLLGDFPGRSWGIRTSAKFGLNPCIYTSNEKGKRVVLAHLWGSGSPEEGIHILVIGKYLKDEFKPLFPKKMFFYGKGPSVDVPYPDLKAGKGDEYLNCFSVLLGLGSVAATPEAAPEATQEAAPEETPEEKPEAAPEADPEPAPEAAAEATPEAKPEATAGT